MGTVASEPEVRQRFGQARQRCVEKVIAQHTVGDQRRREIPECDGEDPGRARHRIPGQTETPVGLPFAA
jgi:hypothetical protein